MCALLVSCMLLKISAKVTPASHEQSLWSNDGQLRDLPRGEEKYSRTCLASTKSIHDTSIISEPARNVLEVTRTSVAQFKRMSFHSSRMLLGM